MNTNQIINLEANSELECYRKIDRFPQNGPRLIAYRTKATLDKVNFDEQKDELTELFYQLLSST